MGAAASPRLRHFYSEHKPLPLARVHLQARRARRTAEQASGTARATLQAEAAALGADAGGGGCLSGALASVPEWWPRRALASRLSARRRAALPLDTATRGRTASQLPSGVDGISFTVHPWAAVGRPILSRWSGYTRFRHHWSGQGSSRRPLLEWSSRGTASPASGELSCRCALHCAAPHHITDMAGNGPARRLPSSQPT